MAGKTVSAHADEEIVRRIEHMARLDARPVSQLVVAALAFYARLPGEAHQALRTIEALGGDAALERVSRAVARELVGSAFELAQHRVVAAIPAAAVAGLGTEDDMLAAAVRLTASAPHPATVPEPAPHRRSGRARAARG